MCTSYLRGYVCIYFTHVIIMKKIMESIDFLYSPKVRQ